MRLAVRAALPDDELVAVVLALDLAARQDAAAAAPSPRAPGWCRAARLEQVGAAPLVSAADPRLTRRPSGAPVSGESGQT